jgi:signal peptidase I
MPPAPAPKKRARPGRIVFWALFGLAVAGLVGGIAGFRTISRLYSEPGMAMMNTVKPGDQVLVQRGQDVHRGDLVVIDVPPGAVGRNGPIATGGYARRVIGLPGDRVTCCDTAGDITINGVGADERSYLYPGDQASSSHFSVTLKPGTVWLMGDDRSIALDSRAWGALPVSDIVGRVIAIKYPSGQATLVSAPQQFINEGLAPQESTGIPASIVLLLIAVAGFIAAIVIGVVGIVRSSARQSRSRRAAGPPPGPGQYVV